MRIVFTSNLHICSPFHKSVYFQIFRDSRFNSFNQKRFANKVIFFLFNRKLRVCIPNTLARHMGYRSIWFGE